MHYSPLVNTVLELSTPVGLGVRFKNVDYTHYNRDLIIFGVIVVVSLPLVAYVVNEVDAKLERRRIRKFVERVENRLPEYQ